MTHPVEKRSAQHLFDARLRALFVTGAVVLAALMDAVASTALSIGRIGLLGDTHATPDGLAMIDIVFIAAKLTSFLVAPLLVRAVRPTACLRAGAVILLLASAAMTLSADLVWICVCRVAQGLAGGTILVAGQTLLFFRFPHRHQPVVQAVFATGAVMAPTTVTPALQGWLVDHLTWDWIFLANIPLGLASLILLAAEGDATFWRDAKLPIRRVILLGIGTTLLTYVLLQGSRFNWFDDTDIAVLAALGVMSVGLLAICEIGFRPRGSLLPISPLGDPDFRFGLLASLLAGFALSGSAYLIPTFALTVLDFTATGAGVLLLPSGAALALALLLSGLLIEKAGIRAIMLAPFGILLFAGAMWLLSGSTSGSGSADLAVPLLLRGFGLGLLFMALTLITLQGLAAGALPFGIGLFNFGKQVGGLAGTALLQTYIDHQNAYNRTILAAHVVSGDPAADQRLRAAASALASNGIDSTAATKAAVLLLQHALDKQAAVISFDEAFFAFVLLFAVVAPFLILAKRLLSLGAVRRNRTAAHKQAMLR
ncbi:MFS transporter [Mesorhizobium sp. CA18]|uniref:MFS transporter n=1 Tax=unclassified Mesorhizobium TaxID=325217 RepID=UPI001CCF9143|nr:MULTISPECIES: MFS transporter [unclassified Mesorhizobium]MBZ9735742.1 MFS transporter [Mesorhizobium sp. CA9]MBZ9827657.1 MFS transporter [Mesorhizobium sp. CA18]MBZ9833359.1 MFS transporter [Mesorhizobium sp. CA2]MBZ9839630.1 MFS transporter [Mesorhizobium sp. CA3]MBZ9879833.1 MFS transporter [Mesorhizobium sp. Ca11]